MRARLFCRYGKLGRLDFEIGQEATLGRARTNTIVLAAPAISNLHARIRLDASRDRYVLEDLGSLNGTELDGVPLEGPEPLGRLHVVTVAGRFDFIFEDRGASRAAAGPVAESEEHSPQGAGARAPVPASGDTDVEGMAPALPEVLAEAEKPGMATLAEAGPMVLPAGLGEASGAGAPKERLAGGPDEAAPAAAELEASVLLELPEDLGTHALPHLAGENVVGRTRDADVSIPRPTVSRRHAILRVEGGRVFIRDLESANRTYVGDVRLEPGEEMEIADGASLRFGDLAARLRLRRADGEEGRRGAGASGGVEGQEEDDD